MSHFTSMIIAVMLFVAFTAGSFALFQVADASTDAAARVNDTVRGENITVDYDTYQQVAKANESTTVGFAENVTLFNASGTELTAGSDYKWNSTDGTLLFLNTTNTAQGNTATIDYDYKRVTDEVQTLLAPINTVVRGVSELVVAVAGLGLATILLAFGAFFARRLTAGSSRRGR